MTQSETSESLRIWTKTLPSSRMIYPSSFIHRMKYGFWKAYTPYHPTVRDTLLSSGIIWHEKGRQNYLLGTIAPDLSIKEFISFLLMKGYGNHFIAWEDEDELVSLRYVENFFYQYHLRVFVDGEIRGHYEYTPECYPISHLREIDMEERRWEFLTFLKGKIVETSSDSSIDNKHYDQIESYDHSNH